MTTTRVKPCYRLQNQGHKSSATKIHTFSREPLESHYLHYFHDIFYPKIKNDNKIISGEYHWAYLWSITNGTKNSRVDEVNFLKAVFHKIYFVHSSNTLFQIYLSILNGLMPFKNFSFMVVHHIKDRYIKFAALRHSFSYSSEDENF